MKDFYSNSPRTGLSQLSPSIPGSRVIVDPHAPAELEPTCANKIRVDNHDHRGGTVLFIQRPEFYWRSADRSGACPEPGHIPQNPGCRCNFPMAAARTVSLRGYRSLIHLCRFTD